MYCVNCGVKLADSEAYCPLCGTEAFRPTGERSAESLLYPRKQYPNVQVSTTGVMIILTVLFLLPILITLQCDLLINRSVTWSGFVIGGLLVVYVAFILPGWFKKPNPVIFVPCAFAAIGGYLLYISLATGGGWFLSFAFPVTGFIGLVVTAVTVLLRYVRRGILYILGGAVLALGLFMPLVEFLLTITFPAISFVGWFLFPLTALVLLGGTMLFLAISRRARETMERKLFI